MHRARGNESSSGDGSGDVERAQVLLKEALALFEDMDVPFYVTQVKGRLGELADAAPAVASE